MFPVVGYVPGGRSIEAILVAETTPAPRIVGRIEFARPGVLNRDACEALAYLTRPDPCIRLLKPVRGVRWVEPRLVATVRYFGRSGTGALKSGVLQGLTVALVIIASRN